MWITDSISPEITTEIVAVVLGVVGWFAWACWWFWGVEI